MKKLLILCIGLLTNLPYLSNAQTLNPGPIFVKNGGSLGLTVTNQAIANGTQIILHAGVNNWKMLSDGGIVLNDNPRFGLTVTNQNISNGTKIILHEGYNRWKLLSDGSIVLKDNPRFGLTIPNQAMYSGTGIILHEGYNQWGNGVFGVKPKTIEPGPLFVKNGGPLGLTVTNQSINNGTQIILHAGLNNWKMLDDGGIVLNNNPRFGLTVTNQNISNGTKIILHEGYNRWKLLTDGSIVLKDNPRFGLTIPNQRMKSGAEIILHEGYNQWDKVSTPLKIQSEEGFRVLVNGIQCLGISDPVEAVDEPYLKTFIDGSNQPLKTNFKRMSPMDNIIKKGLSEFFGEYKELNAVGSLVGAAKQEFWLWPADYYAKNNVIITLYEKDNGEKALINPDDFLGEITINANKPDGKYTEQIVHGTGRYLITYTKLTRKEVNPQTTGDFENPVRVKVKNQGSIGSCWAHATCAAISTAYLKRENIKKTDDVVFDPMVIFGWRDDKTKDGWAPKSALLKMLDAPLPFKNNPNSKFQLKSFYAYNKNGTITQFTKTDKVGREISTGGDGRDKIREALLAGNSMIVDFSVYEDFSAYANYSGSYGGNLTKKKTGAHAVLLTGFKNPEANASGYPAWIIQNSWGTIWGDNGHCVFAVNEVGLDDEAFMPGDFEVYGTPGIAISKDPPAGSAGANKTAKIKVFCQAGYVAEFNVNGSTCKLSSGFSKEFTVPANKAIYISCKVSGTGKQVFETSQTFLPDVSTCYKVSGTFIKPKMNNDCH